MLAKAGVIRKRKTKVVKPCEHPYLEECPLTVVDRHSKELRSEDETG